MPGFLVAIAISALVLFLVWYRRRRTMNEDSVQDAPDRSVVGEAATAFEDIALTIIARGNDRQGPNRDANSTDRRQE